MYWSCDYSGWLNRWTAIGLFLSRLYKQQHVYLRCMTGAWDRSYSTGKQFHMGIPVTSLFISAMVVAYRVGCVRITGVRKRFGKIYASYTLEGAILNNVEGIKYLGVTITNDLRWNTHVGNIFPWANRDENLYACPQAVKEAACKTLVHTYSPGVYM